MAQFLTTPAAKAYLDSLLNLEIVLYSTPPGTDGTGGVELVGGGYAPQPYTTGVATGGLTGETARRVSTSGALFPNMPVANTGVHGLALRDSVSGDVIAVDDAFTPASTFAVGGNYLLNTLTLFTKK